MVEEIGEMFFQEFDDVYRASLGFTLAATTRYWTRIEKQGKDTRELEADSFELNEQLLEEDPHYENGMYEEGKLMETYYDNFDVIKKNAGQAVKSVIYTGVYDVINAGVGDSEAIKLEEYPEMAAGIYLGLKVANKAPTPQEVKSSIIEFREKEPGTISQE